MNVNLPHFAHLFSCSTSQAFVDESVRTKLREVGVYAIVCDGMPPISGKHDLIAYVGNGNLWQRIPRYGYHLHKGEACVLPHRDVHRNLEATFAGGRKV